MDMAFETHSLPQAKYKSQNLKALIKDQIQYIVSLGYPYGRMIPGNRNNLSFQLGGLLSHLEPP